MRKLLCLLLFSLTLPALLGLGRDEGAFRLKGRVLSLGEELLLEVTESEYAYGEYLIITPDGIPYTDEKGMPIARKDIRVGDLITLTYNGQTMLSYPPRVVARSIRRERTA